MIVKLCFNYVFTMHYVLKFENCGVPIAQLIHEVAGSLRLDMGGGPVGYGTVWFVNNVESLAQGWGVIHTLASFGSSLLV